MKKIKVLIVVNELLRGGAQRIILDITRNYDSERFDLEVVVLKSHQNFGENIETVLEEVRKTGVNVLMMEGARRFRFSELWSLMKLFRQKKPDIVHTFLPYTGIIGRIAARLSSVRGIISTQCNLPVAYTKKVYWLDRLTLPLAHFWTGATEGIEMAYGKSVTFVSGELLKSGRKHFSVVAGVDLPALDNLLTTFDREKKRQELSLEKDDIAIMMTARLISWKGHSDLIEAMSYLPSKTKLFLVGWGPLEERLKRQRDELGLINRVVFLGPRNDVMELLLAMDIYTQTHSRAPDGKIWVGPNTAQMEACAAYVPSVSTAVPWIEYLIKKGSTGALAELNNPKDLARAIQYLIDNPKEAKRMADNARRVVEERYTAKAMTEAYQNLYEKVVSRKHT
jgi:glycosyltransferase involved in cell wall biosynthesis